MRHAPCAMRHAADADADADASQAANAGVSHR
ncbi:hypothetical protein FHT08_003643 [Xanthomonas campestris]|nr:hypothetical protein [Xanthomonas sp. CFBP 8151]